MTREQIFTKVQDVFRDVFDEDDLEIKDATNSDDIEDWDSLAQVRLVITIEKKFDIKFNFGELQKLKNVGEMIKIIQNKMETGRK